ncbi:MULTISPECIES: FCD domain-containing protein [unclassified Photobacterium]|uniref:FCD domain-containing protein n=1 Tax=unclassified Photobacterium TaxID=2628852 RepID=UPI001EDE4DB6|nr:MULTISPECIES: FCD domain-containing protein [unclassified Photobacterium]MCG3864202.1 FCD domain-containing protein [Photobacterium sp. Ph6]MCG3875732.1 FCD domain-containing protein [Photobacterium sp. Ph5]
MEKEEFTTISDRLISVIKNDILNGTYLPGEKLILNDLKSRYSVGGSPLREAMVQLAWQKYLVMKPQKGFWVADVSLDELKHIIQSRFAIGRLALKEAISTGDEQWELNILTAFHKLNRLNPDADDFDASEWDRRHKAFHLALVQCKSSEFLLDILSHIYDQQERYRHFLLGVNIAPQDRYHDHGEHEAVMQAVLKRDADLASQLLYAHAERLYTSIEQATSLTAVSGSLRY